MKSINQSPINTSQNSENCRYIYYAYKSMSWTTALGDPKYATRNRRLVPWLKRHACTHLLKGQDDFFALVPFIQINQSSLGLAATRGNSIKQNGVSRLIEWGHFFLFGYRMETQTSGWRASGVLNRSTGLHSAFYDDAMTDTSGLRKLTCNDRHRVPASPFQSFSCWILKCFGEMLI